MDLGNVLRPAIETETDPQIEPAPSAEPTAEPSAQSASRSQSAALVNTGSPRFGRVRGWVSRNVAQRARRLFRPRRPSDPAAQPPVSMAMAAQIVQTASASSRRYSFYTPELNLMAESEYTDGASPAIAHEYIWFAGQPVAQIDSATSTTHWTFTDHLGTPILQTGATPAVTWRAEHEPYGQIYQLRSGQNRHQPLRFPGQEAEQLSLGINGYTERSYNIFRWYRARWGRYSQTDPSGLAPDQNLFRYVKSNPVRLTDSRGLQTSGPCDQTSAACVKCRNEKPGIFWNQTNLPEPFRTCVEWHERDHINFWNREVCGSCVGRPDGSPPGFAPPRPNMTAQERADTASDFKARLECSGYKVEYQCLGFNRNNAANPSGVDDRRIVLLTEARNKFSCPTESW